MHFYSTKSNALKVSINGTSNPFPKDKAIPEISQ